MTMSRSIELAAPAKINLVLHVGRRRADGFHELTSLVCGLTLCDRLTASAASQGAITVEVSRPDIPAETNLVIRAAALLRQRMSVQQGVHFALTKHVPVGAGLGGGSSDAAAALRLCDRLWNTRRTVEQLQALGAELGSDVPLFFHLPAAIIRGRGERVEPISLSWHGSFVLVHGGWPVSTALTYAAFAGGIRGAASEDACDIVRRARTAGEISEGLCNALVPAVYHVEPRVAELHDRLSSLRLGRWGLTGAGSTFFMPLDSRQEAEELASRVERANLNAVVEVADALTAAPTLVDVVGPQSAESSYTA